MPVTNNATIGHTEERQSVDAITGPLTLLFAAAAGVIVTNVFAPQTLVGLIGPALGLAAGSVGLVAMATLLDYAAGSSWSR